MKKVFIALIIIYIILCIFFINKEDSLKIDVASAFYPYSKELFKKAEIDDKIKLNLVSTNKAYNNIINGRANIIIASAPSDEQKVAIEKSGIELEFMYLYSEPLAFLVNEENGINNLSIEDIQNIYYNTKSNWQEYGGENLTIDTYQLEKNNGSQTAFETIVKNNNLGNNHFEVNTMPKIIDKVAYDKSGICYTFYSYFSKMYKQSNVKAITINNEDINSINYPLVFDVYLIYKIKDKNKLNEIISLIG